MFTQDNLSTLAVSFVIALGLMLTGCGSSDSGSGNSNNDSSPFFSSGLIPPGGSYSFTFTQEGEVEYYCEIHAPDMQGKIIVTSSVEAVDRDTVSMENDQFVPAELSVAPNTEVVWINNQNHEHDISSGNPSSGDGGGDDDTPQY